MTGVVRALSVRDGEPDCAEIELPLDEPTATLLAVVAEVRMPPVAPMRAAGCLLLRHGGEPAVADAIVAWMGAANARGLALLAGQWIDALPVDVATRAAEAALAGPHATELRPAIEGSRHPEVRAVAGTLQ